EPPTRATGNEVSDSGSRMGAAGRCQGRSEGGTVRGRAPPTCGGGVLQRLFLGGRSVRIEGVRGSNPLSSTAKLQVAALFRGYFRLSILTLSCLGERTGAEPGQPTSLTSGDVPLFVRRVGAVAS